MNKIAYLKYLIGKRIPRVVSPNVVRYTEGLVKQSLCEVYIKALRAHTGKSEIHAAVIGFDPLMYYNLEVLSDFGVAIDGFYEWPEKDFQHPSKLLRELDLRGFDLLILCALTESEEDSLAEKLGKILSVSDGKCHVLRISRLYFALYSVLSTFRSSLRSGLNPKKLALLAISCRAISPVPLASPQSEEACPSRYQSLGNKGGKCYRMWYRFRRWDGFYGQGTQSIGG